MNVLNYKQKKLFWWNKNYFFIGTFFIIFINLLVFFTNFDLPPRNKNYNWHAILDFQNLTSEFLSAFWHFNLQHCLLNCLCFLVAGGFIERKYGSISLLSLVFTFALICESMAAANSSSTGGRGFSGVNFAFYAYIIIDFIFTFRTTKKSKVDLALSITVLALIYIACCFCGGTTDFSFKPYPYDLINNLGHYTSFVGGIVIALIINLSKLKFAKEQI